MKVRNYLLVKAGEVILVIATLVLILAFKLHAQDIQPSKIFSNGMVLQREATIPVWGTAPAGITVTVTINGNSETATADGSGEWKAYLPEMGAGGPYELTIEGNNKTLTYTDVYLGDVWLASGQSNMEMVLSQSNNGTTEASNANDLLLRQFKIPKSLTGEASKELPPGCAWTKANSAGAANFSAAAFYFGKELRSMLNIPIAIINSSYGGSRIEAWMNNEMLGFDEEDVVLQNGTYAERQPTLAFNKMINPIVGFPIKGFLWYQGESNADNMEDALEYGSLFKTMITGWRELWGNNELPFIWVQLPNYGEAYPEPQTWDAWPQLRANQSKALDLPYTGEAVTIDVGDVDIHPTDKKTVGERLALVARHVAYGEDIVYNGPRYESHRLLENGKVSIHFDNTGSGLLAKNSSEGDVHGFAIAGNNGTFQWADAQIEGDSVIVWNNSVPTPKTIRYAWEYNPSTINLYNIEGLPAAPFKLYVSEPGFSLNYFNSTATTIERGQFAVLTWEVFGSSEVTLNNEPVEPKSGKRVVPDVNSSYILKYVNALNPSVVDSSVINIEVIEPKPTISVRTDVGGVAEPGAEITLIADATPPKDGGIAQVEFFIDGKSVAVINTPPYETKWIAPDETGKYILTGIVTDNSGQTVTSMAVSLYITRLVMQVYEAEDATYTGTANKRSSSLCSNKKYLDLASNGWVLTFDNVEVSEAGTYPLTIRYLLNYESPKAQILIVNGKNLGEITFTAPNTSTWMSYMMDVELIAGINTIAFDDSWGWMSFDYISIAVEDTSTVSVEKVLKSDFRLYNSPNPFDSCTTIEFNLTKDEHVLLEVFDVNGKKVETLLDNFQTTGQHSVTFVSKNYLPGIYFARISSNLLSETRKMIKQE